MILSKSRQTIENRVHLCQPFANTTDCLIPSYSNKTDSNVCIIIGGEKEKTEPIILKDSDRASFRRGGIDSFVISTVKPLGKLIFIKIWHDNSGKNEMASWYLKHIIVHDLQTREKEYFICEKWLAVEKQDKID